jgi:branched-chain amino acid transport system permease protein
MTRLLALLACAAIVLSVPLLLSPYTLRVMDLAVISAIAVVGLCFAFGYAGLIHLGQGAFVGVGAYSAALLTTRAGLGFWSAMPLALVVGAAFAILIGAPLLRLRGHYLALSLFGFPIATDRSYYYLALGFLVLATAIGYALRASRYGRAMIAVRDDELACGACGVTAFRAKLLAFTLASVYGALSGVLYAHYAGYIAPSDFDVVRSITLLVMLIVGGEASIIGAIGGAILVSYAPEWLRFLGQAYLTFFGIAIILVLILLPEGAAGALRRLRRRVARQAA